MYVLHSTSCSTFYLRQLSVLLVADGVDLLPQLSAASWLSSCLLVSRPGALLEVNVVSVQCPFTFHAAHIIVHQVPIFRYVPRASAEPTQ